MKINIELRMKNDARGKKSNPAHIRALVIENESAMGQLIEEALAASEIEPVTLVTSSDAPTRFLNEKFDVILVDVNSPQEHGGRLVRQIRNSRFNRNTPTIMISDDQRPGALADGFDAGASFFVYKPLSKAHLMRLILVTQGTIESEKRRFRRVTVQTRVQIKCADRSMEGETLNLSLNGALVRTSDIFAIGSKVEIILDLLPGTEPVAGKGCVKRLGDDNQMGIQFERLLAADSRRLQDFLLPFIAD